LDTGLEEKKRIEDDSLFRLISWDGKDYGERFCMYVYIRSFALDTLFAMLIERECDKVN
jgi:hypothetical protein